MNDIEKIKFITKISSVSLHALDMANNPIATASGCMINYKGKLFLLTVSHAILEDGRWGMELEYDFGKMGLKYYCPTFQWLSLKKLKLDQDFFNCSVDTLFENPQFIDIAYAALPDGIKAIDEFFDYETSIKYSYPKNVIETSLLDKPCKDAIYSFYGDVGTMADKKHGIIIRKPQLQIGLQYISDYKEDYYRFELPEIIKDINDYKGCSGAPIIDENGKLVSLVTSGRQGTNILIGIKMNVLKVALDIEVNDFS